MCNKETSQFKQDEHNLKASRKPPADRCEALKVGAHGTSQQANIILKVLETHEDKDIEREEKTQHG